MGSLRVAHDWATFTYIIIFTECLLCARYSQRKARCVHYLIYSPNIPKGRYYYSHFVHKNQSLEYCHLSKVIQLVKWQSQNNPGPYSQVHVLIKCILINKSFKKGLWGGHLRYKGRATEANMGKAHPRSILGDSVLAQGLLTRFIL